MSIVDPKNVHCTVGAFVLNTEKGLDQINVGLSFVVVVMEYFSNVDWIGDQLDFETRVDKIHICGH